MRRNRNRDSEFPPVSLNSPLIPVDHPQFLSGAPHNLPPSRERPAVRSSNLLGEISVPSMGGPGALPMFPEIIRIFDPFHFCAPIDGSLNAVPITVATLFSLQPNSRRNYMVLRNASTGAQQMFVGFGTAATLFSALVLAPGEKVLLDPVPQTDAYVIADVAGGIFCWSIGTIAG